MTVTIGYEDKNQTNHLFESSNNLNDQSKTIEIPPEIIKRTLGYLSRQFSLQELARCALVCKEWKPIAKKEIDFHYYHNPYVLMPTWIVKALGGEAAVNAIPQWKVAFNIQWQQTQPFPIMKTMDEQGRVSFIIREKETIYMKNGTVDIAWAQAQITRIGHLISPSISIDIRPTILAYKNESITKHEFEHKSTSYQKEPLYKWSEEDGPYSLNEIKEISIRLEKLINGEEIIESYGNGVRKFRLFKKME